MITLACSVDREYESLVAVLELSPSTIDALLSMGEEAIRLKANKFPSLYGISIFSSYVEYYLNCGLDPDTLQSGWVQVDPDHFENYDPIRTECETTVIKDDEVIWKGYEKHCSINFETERISYKELESFQQKLEEL